MRRYAFLILPSHNRVYADASVALVRAELEVFSAAAYGTADPDGYLLDFLNSTFQAAGTLAAWPHEELA